MESFVRMLYHCDDRSMQIIQATAKAALDSQSKKTRADIMGSIVAC